MILDRHGVPIREGDYVLAILADHIQTVKVLKVKPGSGLVEHQGQKQISSDSIVVELEIGLAAEAPGKNHFAAIRLFDPDTEVLVKKADMNGAS